MSCVLGVLLTLSGLWLGYHFTKGFCQGIGMARRPKFRVVHWKNDDSSRNL